MRAGAAKSSDRPSAAVVCRAAARRFRSDSAQAVWERTLPRRCRQQCEKSTLLRRRSCLSRDAVDHHGHVRDKAHLLGPGSEALRKPPKIDIRQPGLAAILPHEYVERRLQGEQSNSFLPPALSPPFSALP